MTNFSNPGPAGGNGYVDADGFRGPPNAALGASPKFAPAAFPNGFSTPGAITAAAGATQGGATVISTAIVSVTATASTEGVKLSTAFPIVFMEVPGAIGTKVYPQTNGKIGALSTNTAYALVHGTGAVFAMVSPTLWIIVKGG